MMLWLNLTTITLLTSCNGLDTSDKGECVLNKIMAGLKAVYGPACNQVFSYALSKDFGWNWQVDVTLTFYQYTYF